MSSITKCESTAREDYGPTTSSEEVLENILSKKLVDEMNISSIRTQTVLQATALSPNHNAEPDSTNENITDSSSNKEDKEVEYHITEKGCDTTEMSIDSLSGIVRIEEATIDESGHITYPIIQETEELNQGNYIDQPRATLIQTPINTAIVQNVTKLPQNFTFNVDAVNNITAIQNVAQDGSGNQTLWLPTILAAGSSTADRKEEEEHSQSGVSQIIITSESYVSDRNNIGSSANIVTEASYLRQPKNSKVQILSNISLPKNPNYSRQYITQNKEIVTPVYASQNHIYKLNANVSQKHVNSSVLCSKSTKSQSLIGSSASQNVNSNAIKNLYNHGVTKCNLDKPLNKVNNGANLNIPDSSSNTQQCHILSRVVSGPNKMSVHSGRKATNSPKGPKSNQNINQKSQSRAIKIIQQGGSHKTESKSLSVANISYRGQQTAYTTMETKPSKLIQKVGSPTHKTHQSASLPKMSKEHLVLQCTRGPIFISSASISTSLPKGPHYVQSGTTPNLRYVQTFGSDQQLSSVSQVAANQQLTAQILQTLSQPKLLLQSNFNPLSQSPKPVISTVEESIDIKTINQQRIVFGDKSILMTASEVIGVEEKPNLTEELRKYSFGPLAFVMLDHTYALPKSKQPTTSTSLAVSSVSSTVFPIIQNSSTMSPVKASSPITMTTPSYQSTTLSNSLIRIPTPITSIQVGPVSYNQQAQQTQDDDATSNISSIDEDRVPDRDGSDTETAPEGEEEGKTRCICNFTHDDGYMICCDRCSEWQHVDCMGIDRLNIPDAYMCELCQPRPIDRRRARSLQSRKREELNALAGSDSDSSENARHPGQRRKRLLTVTTYTNTSGSCVTTYNSNIPVLPPLPHPTISLPKRGPKQRPKKPEILRKGAKRKMIEKRVKRKKDMMLNKNKYNTTILHQSHWQDSYEQAVTNHYSPELRAKLMKYSSKLGNSSNMASAITAHLCTTVPHAGSKILIATKDLKENMPIIELRGKYMLSNQHKQNSAQNSARAGSQKPGPFVFFYRLPKDSTEICIDTRTYGNEARFVRRSCKPNAELQHCIIKGGLHVYLVSVGTIPSNTEITISHESNIGKQPCACGNPKYCKVNGLNTLTPRKSIDYPTREKRHRSRCYSASSSISPPLTPMPTTPVKELFSPMSPPAIKLDKTSPVKLDYSPKSPLKMVPKSPIKNVPKSPIKNVPKSPVKNAVIALNFDDPRLALDMKTEIDLIAKEEMKPEIDETDYVKVEPKLQDTIEEFKCLKTKVEEVTLDPIEESTKQNPSIPEIKVVEKRVSDEEKEIFISKTEEQDIKRLVDDVKVEDERPATREFTAKSACHDGLSRSSRTNNCGNQDSLDEKSDDSQDKLPTTINKDKKEKKMTREERKMEAIMKAFERMEKAEQRKQEVKERQKRRESEPHLNAQDKEDDDEVYNMCKRRRRRKGRARTTSQSNRHRLNSADSDLLTSGDEAGPIMPRRNSGPAFDTSDLTITDNEQPSDSVREDVGLSSACLLVEAAVGSVESAFKLPKTKKTMATEWIGRSPERTPSPYQSSYRQPLISAPTLESLVRVASTMIGDLSGRPDLEEKVHEEDHHNNSPPRTPIRDKSKPPKKAKRVTRSTPVEVPEITPIAMAQHSAKKRWLRQAISEESDSPIAESPPNEMVTPLKKRRLARESLSCEQNTVVPCYDETSPNLTSEDSPVKDDNSSVSRNYSVGNILDTIYCPRDRARSDSGQGSDDQCNMDSELLSLNIKPTNDSDEIRRIIGVPLPDELPVITKPEDIKTNNNSIEFEESNNYNKPIPIGIDTTILSQPKIQKTIENNYGKVDSPNEKLHGSHSADTSGNSSPQRNEMDDIQKKIHSFHTENIQILKSRNKKPPKEKRKKVNLNFDLNMVDDQISIQLRTDGSESPEVNEDVHESNSLDTKQYIAPENIPLPPVESIPLPATEDIPLPEDPIPISINPPPEAIPLPEEPMKPNNSRIVSLPVEKIEEKSNNQSSSLVDNTLSFSSRFSSTGLFSGIFSNINQTFHLETPVNENIPNMSIIKSAIDRTTILENSTYEKVDELKSVQEILSRVNNMDSNNSLLLSGVLSSSNNNSIISNPTLSPKPSSKQMSSRGSDPRLDPPPVEKPKPVRRKLSITEYRKRLRGSITGEESNPASSCSGDLHMLQAGSGDASRDWSSESSGASLSPHHLEAAAAAAVDELEQRLHRDLVASHVVVPKGVFDAQPTASERQRENLSSRLRREFGLALPEEEETSLSPTLTEGANGTKRGNR